MGSVHVRAVVQPHSSDPATLRAQRDVYRRNQTPVRGDDGQVRALNIRPAGPEVAGRHLDEVAERYGERGLARSINGLRVTRGWEFTDVALRHAAAPPAVLANLGDEEDATGRPRFSAAESIRRSQAGSGVPEQVRSRLPGATGETVDGVRIHDDAHAHAAAAALGARAVTAGRSIYMGAGEYEPSTPAGQHLLAHELAHTIQQDGATERSVETMDVSAPGSAAEVEAERFADAVSAGDLAAPVPRRGSASAMSLMRVITFTRANDAVTTNDPGVRENALAGTFQIAFGHPTAPHFDWTTDVTIHGDAGDPFADFQVGPLQVLRNQWANVWWGTGTNRTHLTATVATPIRDALTAAQTWYADARASANFGANGDVRSTRLDDSPGAPGLPLANPVPPRVSTRGWFNWGVSFIAYISARDTTEAVAAPAFQHLAHCYWNMSANGTFDTSQPAGSRVSLSRGVINAGRVRSGASGGDPPIFGGDVPNTAVAVTIT
jgi:Domain of unknown function (DUF4157)